MIIFAGIMVNYLEKKQNIFCFEVKRISRICTSEYYIDLISDGKIDGLFLVRESNSSTGDYVLSVYYNEQISHFQIRRHREDAFFSIGKFYIVTLSIVVILIQLLETN